MNVVSSLMREINELLKKIRFWICYICFVLNSGSA